ncbi:MAG: site-specific integrase [Sulfurimonas sp.]|jgi:site-specific recombinase XerD|uniref:tyrosine-type recombinase/integrase n=1 Tax=Sulfurimonas sp. TaxID=2022749 RepID=UPI002636F304|nr:site-specific integrase [Sulfurimonas sp.]MDD3477157.1 site-specific integrase [Sulfurimonas sp.]
MAKFTSSKKYEGVQYYIKENGYKTYYVRYKDEQNKLKRVKVGCETEGVNEIYCKNKRIEIINSIFKGEQPPKIVKSRNTKILTLDSIAKKYFETKDNSKSTFERLSKYNKHLAPVLGAMDITKITKHHLIDLQQTTLQNGLSNQTVNMIIELFGTIFNYGFKEELYEAVNPSIKVTKLKVKNTRERFLNKYEIEELFAKTQKIDLENSYGSLLELFCKLSLSTGARMESILHLKKCDINLQNEIIRLTDFKGGSEVYSGYITNTTREILHTTLSKIGFNDYLISFNYDGIKVTGRQLQRRLKPILDELFNKGLDIKDRKNRIVIHSLRHTFASQLALSNVPIRQIQELLNHSDISQTVRYAKLQDDANKQALQGVF